MTTKKKIDLLLGGSAWIFESVLSRELRGTTRLQELKSMFDDLEYDELISIFVTELGDKYEVTNLSSAQIKLIENKRKEK